MIVVFGSINIDLAFAVDQPPRPGETVLCPSYLMNPGGKGANQAVAAARDGAQVIMLGCVGRDAFAEPALAIMHSAGVDTSAVIKTDTPTACAAVWVDGHGENSIVVASGANRAVKASQVPDTLLGPETIVMLQMEVPPAENWALVERAKARGARIILNVAPAAPVPESVLDALDILIVNEIEGAAIASASGIGAVPPDTLPQRLFEKYGFTCVLTLRSRGAILHGAAGGWDIPSLSISPHDTTAAGDTCVGVLAGCLDSGADIVDAARRANVAAALTCLKAGAQSAIPHKTDIDLAMGELPPARKRG